MVRGKWCEENGARKTVRGKRSWGRGKISPLEGWEREVPLLLKHLDHSRGPTPSRGTAVHRPSWPPSQLEIQCAGGRFPRLQDTP